MTTMTPMTPALGGILSYPAALRLSGWAHLSILLRINRQFLHKHGMAIITQNELALFVGFPCMCATEYLGSVPGILNITFWVPVL